MHCLAAETMPSKKNWIFDVNVNFVMLKQRPREVVLCFLDVCLSSCMFDFHCFNSQGKEISTNLGNKLKY